MLSASPQRPPAQPQVDARTVRHFIHQLRSALTAIGPAAEYLSDPQLSEQLRVEMAGIVAQSVGRIEHLLADLSVLVAPERVRPGFGATAVDLPQLVRSVMLRHMDYAQSVGAWLVLEDPGVCPPVVGHPTALEQAIDNALLLVLRAARPGDRVVAEVAEPQASGMLELAVTLRLRPRDEETAPTQGLEDLSGVTLAAARTIAEEHGGSLLLLNDGVGLILRLPASPLPVPPAAAARVAPLATGCAQHQNLGLAG